MLMRMPARRVLDQYGAGLAGCPLLISACVLDVVPVATGRLYVNMADLDVQTLPEWSRYLDSPKKRHGHDGKSHTPSPAAPRSSGHGSSGHGGNSGSNSARGRGRGAVKPGFGTPRR